MKYTKGHSRCVILSPGLGIRLWDLGLFGGGDGVLGFRLGLDLMP
jgi:hypothetical protein